MNSSTKLTPDVNKLAITVGANGLATETVVSQPIKIPVESMVEYEFDQTKFEEYLSSSSLRSSLSHKYKRISPLKKAYMPKKAQGEDSHPIVAEASPRNIIPATPKTGSSTHNDSALKKESFNRSLPILTKRTRQRQRQCLAHQLAKALEQTDRVRYYADLESRKHQVVQSPQRQTTHVSAQLTMEEWTLVKRACSILKERVQKRRANTAHALALL